MRIRFSAVLLVSLVVLGFNVPARSLAAEARLLRVVLVDRAGSASDRALTLLGVPHRVMEASAGADELLAYDVIVLGQDVGRGFSPGAAAKLKDFVEQGGCILALEERSRADGWLPAPVKKDLTHVTATLAAPQHPLVTFPNSLAAADLSRVHGASAYGAFYDLAVPWQGLVSGDKAASWETQNGRRPAATGVHWGLVEGSFRRGKIILCQLVPAEAWLMDAKGDGKCAGRKLMENLVDYALATAAVSRPVVIARQAREVAPGLAVVCAGTRAGLVRAAAVMVDGNLDEWRNTPAISLTSRRCRATQRDEPVAAGGTVQIMWSPQSFYLACTSAGTSAAPVELWLGQRMLSVQVTAKGAVVLVDGKAVRGGQAAVRGQVLEASVPTTALEPGVEADAALPLAVRLAGQLQWPLGAKQGQPATYAVAVLTDAAGATRAGVKVPTDAGDYPELRATVIANLGARVREGRDGRLTLEITWTTNRPTDGAVEFGETTSYGSRATDEVAMANNHRVFLDGLQAGRTIHYRIAATSDVGEAVVSKDRMLVPQAPQVPAGRATAARVPLVVAEPAGVDRRAATVTSGIPLPQGALGSVEQVRLLDAKGTEQPLQTAVLARWADGSIKWLLVDLQASVAAGKSETFTLEYGAAVRRQAAPASASVKVTETSEAVAVSTGPLEFTVNKHNGSLLSEVKLDGQKFAGAAVFSLRDAAGKEFTSNAAAPRTVEVEDAGPLRVAIKVAGDYAAADGARLFSYVARLHVYAGQPHVRLAYTFINNHTAQRFTTLKEMTLRLPLELAPGPHWSVGLDGKTLAGQADLRLLQDRDDHFAIQGGAEGRHADGWLATGDGQRHITVAVGDFWQQYPKGLTLAAGALTVALCPPIDTGPYRDEEDAIYFYLKDGGYKLKSGLAKTHDLLLSFGLGDLDAQRSRQTAAAFSRPLLATATPEWYCSSQAFGQIAAPSPRFAPWDKFLEAGLKADVQHNVAHKEYGLVNWGDWNFWERGQYSGTSNGKAWGNLEYDLPHSLLVQFVRTQDRRFFDRAATAAVHLGDIDVVHAAKDPMELGQMYTHYYHHGETERPRGLNGHTWLRGMVDYGFLTGDRRVLEVAREVGVMLARAGSWRFDFDGTERVPGWPLIGLMYIYRATYDDYYLNAARLIVDVTLRRQDLKRGAWTRELPNGHCNCTPHHTGGCGFMTGLLLSGLKSFHEETGDPRVNRSIVRAADWLIEDLYIPEKKAFRYTSCPRTGTSTTLILLEGLGYAYRLTGDRKYMDIGIICLEDAWRGSPGGCKGLAQATMSPPHFLHDVQQYERHQERLIGPGRKKVK